MKTWIKAINQLASDMADQNMANFERYIHNQQGNNVLWKLEVYQDVMPPKVYQAMHAALQNADNMDEKKLFELDEALAEAAQKDGLPSYLHLH